LPGEETYVVQCRPATGGHNGERGYRTLGVRYPDHLYALYDDGAIFQLSQGAWFELGPIPHPEKTGLTEAEITERIKELAAKHGMDGCGEAAGWECRASVESIEPFHRGNEGAEKKPAESRYPGR